MRDELYKLWLGTFPDIKSGDLKKIICEYKNEMELWEAEPEKLSESLSPGKVKAILKYRSYDKMSAYEEKLNQRDIFYTYPGHFLYPKRLYNIPDYPLLLYMSGSLKDYKRYNKDTEMEKGGAIAVVGARNASPYGRNEAKKLVHGLSQADFTIISGLALGIDSIAHKEALISGGFTIGVLGCGINVCYPQENFHLFQDMKERGMIVSEYGLGVNPMPYRFPFRNRIISGMADGVLVVEAKEKSGSLITADQALEQGRDVYAVPGRTTDVYSRGCNNLIKLGAILVTEVKDILGYDIEDFNKKVALTPLEEKIMACLKNGDMDVEELCEKMQIEVGELLNVLYELKSKALIRENGINSYVLN